MIRNQENQTFLNSNFHSNYDQLTLQQVEIIERVQALSFQQMETLTFKKDKGLCLKYRKMIANMKMTKSTQKCSICFSLYSEGQLIKRFPCKHIYHRDCAKSWLKISRNCPNCRLDLHSYFQKLVREEKVKQERSSKELKNCQKKNINRGQGIKNQPFLQKVFS